MDQSQKNNKTIVIGAGLCGTLLAIQLAQRGYPVTLYEKRPDMRQEEIAAGRSINLALSNRGLKALNIVGLNTSLIKECIPMKGRMIHPLEGEVRISPYSGREGDYINSISRSGLNSILLDLADTHNNISIKFNCSCQSVDLQNGTATFKEEETGKILEDTGEIIVGTDGAGSVVRKSMMFSPGNILFDYSQNFLTHGYKELSIPPSEDGGFRIDKNVLHIWPRGNYMVIALPNLDGSFTVTMFHPYEGENGFNKLTSEEAVKAFFEKEFPDLVPHMPTLLEDYFNNPVGALGTIKCSPWQAYGKFLLMGDAAHAVVPFYGQGMNASFEDVYVFDQVLEKHEGDWEKVFTVFQEERIKNTNAIADLALDNFYEMRDHVANPIFVKKRKLEMELEQKFPTYYSKYSLVTFNDDIPYAKAMELGRKQDELLMQICSENDPDTLDLSEVLHQLKQLQS